MRDIKEIASETRQAFLPNRYEESFNNAFQELTGDEVPVRRDRQLSVESKGRTFRWIRGRDVPSVLALTLSDQSEERTIGFTGSEWAAEYRSDLSRIGQAEVLAMFQASETPLGRLAIIAPNEANIDVLRARAVNSKCCRPLGVVTAYPNLVNALGLSDQFNIMAEVAMSGCVEGVAAALGLPAVDLVSSGGTLNMNGFVIVEELMTCYPTLITGTMDTE